MQTLQSHHVTRNSIAALNALTGGQIFRMGKCGRPLTYIRFSDAEEDGHFFCCVRWCEPCQKRYRSHVFKCLRRVVSDSKDWVMLTLTAPAPIAGMAPQALSAMLEQDRRMWHEAMNRVAWYRHHTARGDQQRGLDQLQPPRLSDGFPHPRFASTFDDAGDAWPELDEYGYYWARQVTAGKGKRPHWHVHRHVHLPLELAEMINAAWQLAGADLNIGGRGWLSTDIMKLSSASAARYMAGYMSSENELENIAKRHHRAYCRAMRGKRRFDSGGCCRPLGIARKPSDDPVWAVRLPGYENGLDGIVDAYEFFSGKDAVWRNNFPRNGGDWSYDFGLVSSASSRPMGDKHSPDQEGHKTLIYKDNFATGPPAWEAL